MRLGAPNAITATTHKLARLIYFFMLKKEEAYVDIGQDAYERQYHSRVVDSIRRRAKQIGFELVATAST